MERSTPRTGLLAILAIVVCGTARLEAHLVADVSLSIEAPEFVTLGQQFDVRVIASDLAYDPAYGIIVTNKLPFGVLFLSATGVGWNCTASLSESTSSAGEVRCSNESIRPGSSAVTIRMVAPASEFLLTDSASVVTIGSYDPDASNDSATASTAVYAPARCQQSAPIALFPTSAGVVVTSAVPFQWSPIDGATRYDVYLSVEGESLHRVATADSASLTIPVEGGTSTWQVKANFQGCPPTSSSVMEFHSEAPTAQLVVEDFAGSTDSAGDDDGPRSSARFRKPSGVAVAADGSLYIIDRDAHTLRRITDDGEVTTLLGRAGAPGSSDGLGPEVRFNAPAGMTVAPGGYLYIADTGNQVIRQVLPGPLAYTIAGRAGSSGYIEGVGAGVRFHEPVGLAADNQGTLFIADTQNEVIRAASVTLGSYDFSTSAYAGVASHAGARDGPAAAATFNAPTGLVLSNGDLYVTDTANSTVRKIAAGGSVVTFAGVAASPGAADGSGNDAQFASPTGIAVDEFGNLYVCDTGNQTIRRISPSGRVTTIAGAVGQIGHANGRGPGVRFHDPIAIAVAPDQTIYIADSQNHSIRVGSLLVPLGGSSRKRPVRR